MYVCCAGQESGGWKMASDFLELELHMVVSHLGPNTLLLTTGSLLQPQYYLKIIVVQQQNKIYCSNHFTGTFLGHWLDLLYCTNICSCNTNRSEKSSCALYASWEITLRTGDWSSPCFGLNHVWVLQQYHAFKIPCLWSGRGNK